MADLAANLDQVRARIVRAAERSGRAPDEVTLIAVSKTRPAAEIVEAHGAGQVCFGENYAQECAAKAAELAGLSGLEWHFIGRLQRNKAKYVTPFCTLIHSVDTVALAEEISRRAARDGRGQPILLQVDLAGEEAKGGCPEAELGQLVEAVSELPGVDWQGLMVITPFGEDPETARPYYRRLCAKRQELLAQGVAPGRLRHLSMGMSNDYEVAIEEGATLVRVGTAIFGPRG